MSREYFDPQFLGTENWTRHPIARKMLYTDSIVDFAEKHKAHWVIDLIASYIPRFEKFDFVLLTIDVTEGKALFYAQEDSGMPHFLEQAIYYTDLDVSIRLYLERSEEPYLVLMFPSDH
jgi:hypothetical protein